jgi:hypothetical protein
MKAAPVEYVKVCPSYGPGFFYIPGTQTCIRVGGSATFQGYVASKYTQGAGAASTHSDTINSEAEARMFFDVRDNTEFGLLRTFVRIQWIRSSGSDDNSGSQPRRGQWFNSGGTTGYTRLQTGFQASNAYVQLGGFLAGRTESFAGPSLSAVQATITQPSNGRVNQLAYTASLSDGMSLTAAVEDAAEIREGIYGWTTAGQSYLTADIIPNNVPDVVASFDVAQAWGTFKLAGVWHHVNVSPLDSASSKEGFAVTAYSKINLPMLAAGDNIQLLASYGQGAAGRVLGNLTTNTNASNSSGGQGNAQWAVYDGAVIGSSGTAASAAGPNKLVLSTAYNIGAQFQHFFTPTVSSYLGGSFGKITYGNQVKGSVGASVASSVPRDGDMWGGELGLIWTPISGLEINPSIAYRKQDITRAPYAACPSSGFKTNICSDDWYEARLRVARSF